MKNKTIKMKTLVTFALSFLLSFLIGEKVIQGTNAQVASQVYFSPEASLVNVGDQATINVDISGAENLGAYQFTITFDPQNVQLVAATDGEWLTETGRTVVALPPEIDNASGSATIGAFSFGANEGPSGTGTLATLTFAGQGAGSTDLILSNVIISDTNAQEQQVSVTPGTVAVVSASPTPSPTPEVTPTPSLNPSPSVTPSPTSVPSPTPSPSPSPSLVPSPTPSPSPSATPTPTPIPSPTPVTPSPSPSPTPIATPSPSPVVDGSAVMWLTGGSEVLIDQEFSVDLHLTTDTAISGIDALILFDPRRLTALEVTDRHLLPTTPSIDINNGSGAIALSQIASPGTGFTGEGIVATITFRPLVLGQTNVGFEWFLGSKADSNAISRATGNDILLEPEAFALSVIAHPTLQLQLRTYSESTTSGHSITGLLRQAEGTYSASLTTDTTGQSDPVNLDDSSLGHLIDFIFKVSGYLGERFSLNVSSGLNTVDVGLLKAGDLNDDGIINSLDLALMYDQWFAGGSADFNRDGVVNTADYWVLTQNFLQEDE